MKNWIKFNFVFVDGTVLADDFVYLKDADARDDNEIRDCIWKLRPYYFGIMPKFERDPEVPKDIIKSEIKIIKEAQAQLKEAFQILKEQI